MSSSLAPGPGCELTALARRGGDAARRRLGHARLRRSALAALGARAAAARGARRGGVVAHRRLLAARARRTRPLRRRRARDGRRVHVALAALAFAAALVVCAQTFRGEPVAGRPVARLRDADEAADHDAAAAHRRVRACSSARRACPARRSSSRRWPASRSRAAARARSTTCSTRHRPADGQAHGAAAGRGGTDPAGARARVRARALGALVRPAREPVNVLTAALALAGNLFYVLVYTRWLKRSTPQNIVIGGAAGAVPPLVGWAAATGNLALPALWLFLIVFFWTPPHFWALALLIRESYAAAKVPMLPVVRGDGRRRGRSSSTRSCWSASRSPSGSGSARSTRWPPRCSAASSSASRGSCAAADAAARGRPVPLLAPLPGAAVRRGGRRTRCSSEGHHPRARAEEPAPGLGALRLFVLLFAGTFGVALLYLALD